jgi:hypothetical protein
MPVMASTASVSARPWSMHSERQVQNEVAWPMTARSRRRSSSAPPNGAARTSLRSLSRPRLTPPGTTSARSQTPVRLS